MPPLNNNSEWTAVMPALKKNIIGLHFGRLKVISEGKPINHNGKLQYTSVCLCDCGRVKTIRNRALGKGGTVSCGCYRDIRPLKHGHNRGKDPTGTYQSWIAMRQRCNDPTYKEYHNYGGAGIKVCQGFGDFSLFLNLLGERPQHLTIDRWPDKYGNYSCGQCSECLANGWAFNLRWATPKQQMRNMSRNVMLTVRGSNGCLAELCEHFGVSYSLTNWRLLHGWTPEDAFFKSKGSPRSRRVS